MKKEKQKTNKKRYSASILKTALDFFNKYDIFQKTMGFHHQQFYCLYIDKKEYAIPEICTMLSYDERTFYRHYKRIEEFLEELAKLEIISKKKQKNTGK